MVDSIPRNLDLEKSFDLKKVNRILIDQSTLVGFFHFVLVLQFSEM